MHLDAYEHYNFSLQQRRFIYIFRHNNAGCVSGARISKLILGAATRPRETLKRAGGSQCARSVLPAARQNKIPELGFDEHRARFQRVRLNTFGCLLTKTSRARTLLGGRARIARERFETEETEKCVQPSARGGYQNLDSETVLYEGRISRLWLIFRLLLFIGYFNATNVDISTR